MVKLEEMEGTLTGILIDNAVDLFLQKFPAQQMNNSKKLLQDAEKNCFAVGLTTIDDCGLDFGSVDKIKALQDKRRSENEIVCNAE